MIGEGGFEALVQVEVQPESFKFHSATCSCIVELIQAVTLPGILSNWDLSQIFSIYQYERSSENAMDGRGWGGGAQRGQTLLELLV